MLKLLERVVERNLVVLLVLLFQGQGYIPTVEEISAAGQVQLQLVEVQDVELVEEVEEVEEEEEEVVVVVVEEEEEAAEEEGVDNFE